MSKQSKAKEEQGYVDKAVPNVCGNCSHYRKEFVPLPGVRPDIIKYQCGIGGFAVKKMGWCLLWAEK